MARITVEDCIDKFESRFELVLVASNRARRLHSGDNPTVEKDNDKNTVIALREIADETIPIDVMKNNLIEEYQTVSMQNEEDLTIENSDLQDGITDNEIKESALEVEDHDNSDNEIKESALEVEDHDNSDNEIKESALEVEDHDNSESIIEEMSDKQDSLNENNEEFSNKTDQLIED